MNSNNSFWNREKIADDLINLYITKKAPSVIFIQAGCGQGKSYIVDCLVNKLKSENDIKIYRNIDSELIAEFPSGNLNINSINISGGVLGFSLGLGIGLDNNSSYLKIRNILSAKLKNNILICVENISDVSDNMRLFVSSIIKNISKLEKEFNKKILLLITDTQETYKDIIYKNTNSHQSIKLPMYTKEDVKEFLNARGAILKISEEDIERIWTLSQGNLDLVDFLFEEILINQQDYMLVLQDIVAKRIAIIKDQGLKNEINEKKMEEIVFAASLTLKEFSAQFLTNIIREKINDVEKGLDIVKQEALIKEHIKNYYDFISEDIQKHIAEMTFDKHGNLLISYYKYYTDNEQDEYYSRAYYIYKYWNKMCDHAFSLFMLAYASAKQMDDIIKIKKIENIIMQTSTDEKYKYMYKAIYNYYNILYSQSSIEEVESSYENIMNEYIWEIPIKAELSYEYFCYMYINSNLNEASHPNILNECIDYAKNELIIETNDSIIIKPVDETILRLKIIYGISPYILDVLNDYDAFWSLYDKSKELSSNNHIKQCGIGIYIQNVFYRKAFLYSNPASCNKYYEMAKKYFKSNEIWIEYYLTLICQAGTDIVIQDFNGAIELCQKTVSECREKNIELPQIEKLYNNQIIADFLLKEKDSKTYKKAITFAKTAIRELRKQISKQKNENQFVIYTNICSLYLYTENDKQYKIYKKRLEKLYGCIDISDITDENIDDFYRYYFSWFELYLKIKGEHWEDALQLINKLDNFIPALFRKQEIFWNEKNKAAKAIIISHKKISAYDFCHNLVKTKRNEQNLAKFFYRGLMLSDLQYTSYI